MAKPSAAAAVDGIIADLSEQLEKVKRLRDVLDDPDLADRLEAAFSNGKAKKPRRAAARRHPEAGAGRLPIDGSQTWKIFEFLRKSGNKPSLVRDIANATGIPRTAASSVIYGKSKDKFDKMTERSAESERMQTLVSVKQEAMRAFEATRKGGKQ